MEYKTTRNKANEQINIFSREECYYYAELPIENKNQLFGKKELYLGVFYNEQRQIIGVNTHNHKEYTVDDESLWNVLLLKCYMLTSESVPGINKKQIEWWNSKCWKMTTIVRD